MPVEFEKQLGIIFASCACGFLWSAFNLVQVFKVNLDQQEEEQNERLNTTENKDKVKTLKDIGQKISDGAKAFLNAEYKVCGIVLFFMAIILYLLVDGFSHDKWRPFSAIAFLIGATTSICCGYAAMMIAVSANFRTSFSAQKGLAEAYKVALAAGVSMGFVIVSGALLTLTLLIVIYKYIHLGKNNVFQYEPGQEQSNLIGDLFEFVAGYGLGGSTVGLFGRVGGGIYTKAADVGADLVGKVEQDLPEDSPRNPATIADNVGDNVGDVAGMGADLFGSFAESTCAALVVSGKQLIDSKGNYSLDNLMFPLMITAFGIFCCIIVSAYGVYVNRVNQESEIESSLKKQLLFSTILLTPVIIGISYMSLPSEFVIQVNLKDSNIDYNKRPYHGFICVLVGLWSGLAIGYITEYMTSHSYGPVREVANACKTGAATNIIYGLALGYLSTIIPIIAIGVSAYVSIKLLGFYGVALAALGMLSNLPIGLAIDGYGPISDNAGGIAEMSELGEHIRQRTDALDAAGNTTAAIGKGFAIGSAALVSLSLYGGFITNATAYKGSPVVPDITQPLVFASLIIGAMLPYAFSAFTMKSVGLAADQMVKEIRRQIKEDRGIITGESEPDYQKCIMISTQASLREMVLPALLVILSPVVTGLLFGPLGVAGLLPGALVSGVQMAVSASNTGGAWDNAKKYIEGGNLTDDNGEVRKKGSDEHKAAVIGDTVGDPLKDTSGPALNILVKLMAIISLVFANFFCETGFLNKPFGDN